MMNRVFNNLLGCLGVRVARIGKNRLIHRRNADPLGSVVHCFVPDHELVEHICKRPKTASQRHAEQLETLIFGEDHYLDYRSSLDPLEDFLRRAALPKDFSLLDVGCAVGQLVPFLQEVGFSGPYFGMDIAHGFVVSARRRFDGTLGRYHFIQVDASMMPFHDASFDVVYSRSTLISTYDWKRALQQHLRVAKKWLLLLQVPFHSQEEQDTVFFMQHSKLHTSLLCSMTRTAFLKELPESVRAEIRPCSSGFEVINFGQVKWYDVFIELP